MNTKMLVLIIAVLLLLLAAAVLIWFLIKRQKCKKRVRRMCMPEKLCMLEKLAEPFGFSYLRGQDVFTGTLDAWQKEAGYRTFYDRAAVHFHMIFDALPVYYDYEGKTWLIELWKGQYGISTGAEVGVYHAKKIVDRPARRWTQFEAADVEEMPHISYRLERKGKTLFSMQGYHWWLAGFRVGTFSRPGKLRLMTTISFREREEACQFYGGLEEAGVPSEQCRISGNEVHVCFEKERRKKKCVLCRAASCIYRGFLQIQNAICCKLFVFVTRPFTETADRMLFLYFLLPGCYKRALLRPGRRFKGYVPRRQEAS